MQASILHYIFRRNKNWRTCSHINILFSYSKIGVKKVADFANRTTKKRHNFPYVSKIAYNIPGNYPYVMVDGYYVIKTIHAPNWVKFFEALNDDLNLGIKVYYK